MNVIQIIQEMVAEEVSQINWERLEMSEAGRFLFEMKKIQQNPKYHGEGDVCTHTKMVCEKLLESSDFRSIGQRQRLVLFSAALLHDIGKIRTTKMEDDTWIAPNHSAVGSYMAREFLWKECGLCGTPEKQALRESICCLIRHHMVPGHLFEQPDPERSVRRISLEGVLATDFSWKLLCVLSEADSKGKIAADRPELLDKLELCRLLAEETGCMETPYPFASDFTARAYLSGRKVAPHQALYDDTWGEVVMLSGLPGTGKDTWLREHYPELPVISLDEIRKALKRKPTDPQGPVIQAAHELAKEYLRKKQPFVWNATDLTIDIRQKQIGLFERYGAGTRIIFLETEWEAQLERNRSRTDMVPEPAIQKMFSKTSPPMPWEAQHVEWYCV